MKRLCFIFVLLGLTLGIQAQRSVTINACYQWAAEQYPLTRQYELIRLSEQFTLSNASKGYLPQVALNAKATYQNEVTHLPVDLSAFGMQIPVLNKDQYQVVAEVNQTVWDGGAIRSAKNVARAKSETEEKQLETELYTLNDRINQLFFGILLQDRLLAQNAVLQSDLQVNIDKIEVMMANGVANQSDLESMTVELLNGRQKEIEIKAARKAYLQMLSVMTGQSLTEQDRFELPEDGLKMSAEILRPELVLFDRQTRVLKLQDKQVAAGIMPRIGLFVQGGYGRPGLNMLSDDFSPFYIGGVRLSWNLGKMYTWKNEQKQLETNIRSVDVKKETFLFNTRLELTQQRIEIEKMDELIRSDDEIVRLRSNIRKSAEVKLENGVASVTDLIREIHAEDLSRQQQAAHRIQRLLAIYTYNYTTNQ